MHGMPGSTTSVSRREPAAHTSRERHCRTLGIETVHHRRYDLELVLDGKVDEVGVEQHVVGRTQLGVVFEEECRRHLRSEEGHQNKLIQSVNNHFYFIFQILLKEKNRNENNS